MATTKIWNIKGRLGDVVQYATNPEKNKNPDYKERAESIGMVIEYATNKMKTQNPDFYADQGMGEISKEYFVSAVNCSVKTAIQEMNTFKKLWKAEDGIVAFHGYQSFAPQEVTPELAHEIGVKLAKELWGNRFQVVVSTHLNSKCIHNHFVINSVSFKDGKKYYDNHESYDKMRLTSDRLCRENKLSVITDPKRGRKISYSAYLEENKNHPSKRNLIKSDIDNVIKQSMTMKQFFAGLKKLGYEYKTDGMYFRVKSKEDDRFFRVDRKDKNYSLESIKRRILENGMPAQNNTRIGKTIKKYRFLGVYPFQKKKDSLQRLYLYYCYKLGYLKKAKNKRKHYPMAMREDLQNLSQFSNQTALLFRYRLDTKEQVFYFMENKSEEIETLTKSRVKLRNSLRGLEKGTGEYEKVKMQISSVTSRIAEYRKEVVLCNAILQRSEQIKQNLQPQIEKGEDEQNNPQLRYRK